MSNEAPSDPPAPADTQNTEPPSPVPTWGHIRPETNVGAESTSWRVEFTGSGSEYFRIWIVNMMLILVTFGSYLPFARARRIQYFYANTRIDGHALAFHGNPWLMFRGFMVVAAFGGVYYWGKEFAPMVALGVMGLFYLVFPALWRASLQFRLGNTSWRGLRMRYTTGLGASYKAMFPIYIPAILIAALMVWAIFFSDTTSVGYFTPGDYSRRGDNLGQALLMTVVGLIVFAVATVVFTAWSLALVKRVQHGGYAWAQQQGELTVRTGGFVSLVLKGIVVSIGASILIGKIGSIFGVASGRVGDMEKAFLSTVLFGTLVYLVLFAIVRPWYTSRLQNLVWNGTRSQNLQFHSALYFAPLALLTAKNFILIGITLGLYYPFAAVHMAKMRLEAVHITVQGDVDSWINQAQAGQSGVIGDAAGDFFGFDLGL